MNLLDVQRIEVLRGPQGTLFGKNSIGGAINVVSVMPEDFASSKLSALAGSYNRVEIRGAVNVPVAENLFVRLTAGMTSRDGFQKRLTLPSALSLGGGLDKRSQGGEDSQAARLQIRWLPSDTLTIDISGDVSRRRSTNSPNHVDEVNTSVATIANINALIAEGRIAGRPYDSSVVTSDLLVSYAGGRNYINQDVYGFALTAEQEFGGDSLKGIFSYRNLKTDVGVDIDGSDLYILDQNMNDGQNQYSGELQWNGVGLADNLKYTLGVFGLVENNHALPNSGQTFTTELVRCGCFYPPTQVFSSAETRIHNESYAVFGQATYKLLPKLSATFGARYSYEKKRISAALYQQDANLEPTSAVLGTGRSSDHWESFTYRAGIEYQATPDVMTYVSIAKGYKSGGFNGRSSAALPNLGLTPYDPELATTVEVGLRSEWFDRHLRFNATLFNNSYDDLQLRSQVIIDNRPVTLIGNAAKARIRGAEVEIQAVPFDGMTLSGSYGFTDAKYLEIGNAPDINLRSKFQRTPRNTFNVSGDYRFDAFSGSILLHADYAFRSKEQFQLIASPYDQKAYGLLGARISYEFGDDGQYALAVFGTNLTDVRYRNSGRHYLLPTAGISYSGVGAPREFGVSATVKF